MPANLLVVNSDLTISQKNIMMRKILPVLFFALFSTQIFAQKESSREYPWAKAAKIIEADEAKSRKAEQLRRAEIQKPEKKPEKKIDAENKKGQ
jgi:hypothetical protein